MGAEAIAAILTGIGTNVINAATLAANVKSQKSANDYAKILALVQMMREDTAVQRRVADLKAAGLSPTLAAGSAAQSAPLQKINPVEHNFDTSALEKMGPQIANLIQQGRVRNAEIDKTVAQTDAIRQQMELDKLKFPHSIQNLDSRTKHSNQSVREMGVRLANETYDYLFKKEAGPVPQGELGKTIRDVSNIVTQGTRQLPGVTPKYELSPLETYMDPTQSSPLYKQNQ